MSQNSSERLLVLIPAYNEQGSISQVVNSVRQTVPYADVLVVDDGSVDKTADLAKLAGAFVVRHPFNLCIGGAVQTGLKFAQQEGYDFVIRLDGDGQHNPADIPLLCAVLQAHQADVVIGSRFLGTKGNMRIPLLRRLGISTFALAITLLTGSRATDTTSGFLGLNRRAIQTLATYMPQDYPEVESRIILHKAGLTTLELPARMNARCSGVSSINHWRSVYYAFKVMVAMLVATIKDITVLPKETSHADTY
ncbi:MAG: glycosyltransferase family 2 protein [Anaerolineae bacterium]|nr:glycosyltransferase family 2 protein [Anaerolineae bacterium]